MAQQHEVHRWREIAAEEPLTTDEPLAGFTEQETPWRFETLAANLSQTADRILDLDEELPHASEGTYDLVISRFGQIDATEIPGLLQPDGAFLTEQAGHDDLAEILEDLSGPSAEPVVPRPSLMDLENALVRAGLTIERAAAFRGRCTFADVETLLRYTARMPWLPTLQADHPDLEATLERLAERFADGPLEATASRFVLLARAPGTPDSGRLDLHSLPGGDLEVPRV